MKIVSQSEVTSQRIRESFEKGTYMDTPANRKKGIIGQQYDIPKETASKKSEGKTGQDYSKLSDSELENALNLKNEAHSKAKAIGSFMEKWHENDKDLLQAEYDKRKSSKEDPHVKATEKVHAAFGADKITRKQAREKLDRLGEKKIKSDKAKEEQLTLEEKIKTKQEIEKYLRSKKPVRRGGVITKTRINEDLKEAFKHNGKIYMSVWDQESGRHYRDFEGNKYKDKEAIKSASGGKTEVITVTKDFQLSPSIKEGTKVKFASGVKDLMGKEIEPIEWIVIGKGLHRGGGQHYIHLANKPYVHHENTKGFLIDYEGRKKEQEANKGYKTIHIAASGGFREKNAKKSKSERYNIEGRKYTKNIHRS